MKKAQGAVEFVIIASFLLVIFVSVVSIMNVRTADAKQKETQNEMKKVSESVREEIDLALSVEDGYVRHFTLPYRIDDKDYDIRMIANREIVVSIDGKEYVVFLPEDEDIVGYIGRGTNKIVKQDGILYVSAVDVIINDQLQMRTGSGPNKATLNNNGDIILANTFHENMKDRGGITETSNDEFIVKNSLDEIVMLMDLDTGDLYTLGEIFEFQSYIPSDNAVLVYKNDPGDIVIKVDEGGDLFVQGQVIEHVIVS